MTNNITKILVPVDFSEYSDDIIRYAATLSRRFEAPLLLLHVWDPTTYIQPDGFVILSQTQIDGMLADLQKRIDKYGADALASGAVKAETSIVQGYPASTIVQRAVDQHCDLIVMGTHGRTGWKHVFIGSVAENVVRTAKCPVLTVHSTAKAA